MVRFLMDTVRGARVPLMETAGAVAVVTGLGLWLGTAAALIGAGVALLAKSFEWDVSRSAE